MKAAFQRFLNNPSTQRCHWPGQCSCGSGMADERAPTHLSGLQWLLYGEHPPVLAELDPMSP